MTGGAPLDSLTGVTTSAARFQVQSPARFTLGAIITSSLYGLILFLPVLIAILAVTAFPFGVVTFLVPLAAIVVATFFLPLGFGNPYICRLVRPLRLGPEIPDQFVVQLTRQPRIHTGLRALLDDADDVGIVSYSANALEFYGDSVRLSVPFSDMRDLQQRNGGGRALFVYGRHIVFRVEGLPEAGLIRLAERSSCLLPTSRRNADRMYHQLRGKKVAAATSPTES